MAKRRRKARRKNPPAKKRHHAKRTHHRRRRAANPKRTHARRRRRVARANPRRTHRRRAHARTHHRRAHRRNPARRTHHRRRHHRRNPGFGAELAMAIAAGLAGFAGTFALGYLVTPAAQMVTNGQRNRSIVGVVGAGAGLYLAKKHPFLGTALAVGSLLGAFGGWLTVKVLGMLPAKTPATPAAAATTTTTTTAAAVFADDMSAVQYPMMGMGAYAPAQGGIQAVYSDDMSGYAPMQGMGDTDGSTPTAPWTMSTPFDVRGY